MRILLLGFVRIAHMPYMYDYIELLKEDHELDLISWNRSGEPDAPLPAGIERSWAFNRHIEDAEPLQKKLPRFKQFRDYALSIIDQRHYDRIVVMHSTPGITILDRLLGQYRGRYLLDYRDMTYENHLPYRVLIAKLAEQSGLVLASSPSYLPYLAKGKEVLIKHNLLEEKAIALDHQPESQPSRIRIRYWGMIRHEQANVALLNSVGNDPRFEIHYHGREEDVARNLRAFCAIHNIENAHFHGSYYAPQRAAFAAETDLIHNMYENDFATKQALGNKLYDGIQFEIPQICTAGSAMGKIVQDRGIGLAVDYSSPDLADIIYDYYRHIDFADFRQRSRTELTRILQENRKANEAIIDYFSRE